MRRARDYGLRTHLVERLLERVGGDGWLARLAYDAGLKPPVVVAHDAVCLAALAAGVPPLRLAFASDFHAGPTTDPRAIEQACAALAALEPDLLLLGGDYVSLNARSIEPLATLVGSVPARLGRFAVLGNHDLWADDHLIVRRLQAAGVEVLLAKLARSAINASRRLPAPYDQLWLCGLDDPTSGQPDVITTFDDATGVRLVLMHVPEGLGLLDGVRFELALSGHTHGGQLALPGGRPVWVPPGRWNRRYPVGRHLLASHGGATLLVSRGVGYGGLPLPLFAPAEIHALAKLTRSVFTVVWTTEPAIKNG